MFALFNVHYSHSTNVFTLFCANVNLVLCKPPLRCSMLPTATHLNRLASVEVVSGAIFASIAGGTKRTIGVSQASPEGSMRTSRASCSLVDYYLRRMVILRTVHGVRAVVCQLMTQFSTTFAASQIFAAATAQRFRIGR